MSTMTDDYKAILHQATQMESHLHDVMDHPHTQAGIGLRDSFRHYKEQLQSHADPRHMIDQSHHMMEQMNRVKGLEGSERPMEHGKIHEFHSQFEHHYQAFRNMHNY